MDAINLNNFYVENGLKQILRVGDMIHANLNDQVEEDYFLGEVKFKFVAYPQINPGRITDIGDWQQLKRVITELSGQENSWNAIENRLQNLRQSIGESMLNYVH